MFHASLLPFRTAKTLGGTVILKLTDSTGTSYRLARVAQMSVTVKNASNDGEPIMPGDKVTLSFDGLYRGMDKVSGIFNPTLLYLNYSAEEEESKGQLTQYWQMDRASRHRGDAHRHHLPRRLRQNDRYGHRRLYLRRHVLRRQPV